MNKEFRGGIQRVAEDSLKIIEEYIQGKRNGTDRVKEAVRMLQFGLKVEHMNQIKEQGDKSLAMRLIKFLPKDIDRDEYIRETNPQIQPLLLGKPKKKAIDK